LLATGELRSIFGNAPGSSTKTIELTSRSDNSKMPEQVRSPSDRLAIVPTAPQATQPSSPTVSLPIAPTVAQPAKEAPARLATVGGASEPAPTARGVTDSEIRFGISARPSISTSSFRETRSMTATSIRLTTSPPMVKLDRMPSLLSATPSAK
jgi:hypothetical protein